MHGERTKPPAGFASDGCIIMPRQVRMECWNSNDHDLQVIHQQPQLPVNFDWPTPPVDQCGVGAALINLWQAQIEWIGKVGIGPVPNVPKPPTEEE
jgi:hypothetical protein